MFTMAEATATAPAAMGSTALDAQAPTPIAQLSPELPDRESRVIDGVVTITWPYSIVTRSAAFIVAEHDFRLRHARGQLRLEFHGPLGQKLADAGIGGGDSLRISLEGVQWEAHKSQTRVPGTILEWQLKFTNRLLMRVQRADNEKTEILDLNLPDNAAEEDALLATLTSQGSSPPMHSSLFATEVVSTPGARSPDYALPAKRPAASLEPTEFASPAFLKRARVSYGSLFEDGFDIFDEDVARKKKKTKRSRFSMGASGWKYSSRSPSPEPQGPETHELESDLEVEDETLEIGEPAAAAILSPTMVDEASQTQDASFAEKMAEQTRDSASLLPSSPTPMAFEKPEQSNGHFAVPALGISSTSKDDATPAFDQTNRPLFGANTNIFAPATTTPSKISIFGSSFGNSGFSVEHTTTASTSSIPVFNDALAESIQSREAAEERAPGQPEPAFDEPSETVPQAIDLGFEVREDEEPQETDTSATPGLPQSDILRNPFAVEPFPQAALSASEPTEDIYEAGTYPEIKNDKPRETKQHAFDLSWDQLRNAAVRSAIEQDAEENAEEDDESTDYEIEPREPQDLHQVESEEEGEHEEDSDQDEEGYDEEESGFNEHYDDEEQYDDEEEEERYDEDDEDDEDEELEEEEHVPPSRDRSDSQAVVISLLSDSEDEDEPAPPTSASPAKTETKPTEPEQADEITEESEAASEDEITEGLEDIRQPSAEEESADTESDAQESVSEGEALGEALEDEDDGEGSEDASADEHSEEVSIVQRASDEDLVDAKSAPHPAEEAESIEEPEHVDEMDVDEDEDQVSLIPMAEPERLVDESAASDTAGAALEEEIEDVDAMEDVASEPTQADVSDVKGTTDVKALVVTEAADEVEDMIKSQPDVDMDATGPEVESAFEEEVEVVRDIPAERDGEAPVEYAVEEVKVVEGIPTERDEEVPVESTSTPQEKSDQVIEEITEEAIEEVPAPEVPTQDEPEPDVEQLAAEAEAAARTTARTTRSARNNQLPTPIDTQMPVTEAAEIEIVQTQEPSRPATEENDEDDMAASQQIMGEFLQHASPKQDLPPPPPASAKEHRRKRSDTLSETGRRTRSQAKLQPDEESEAAVPKSSPRSHRRSSRSIDKTNDTVATSIEPNTSMSSKHGDRTPLLQRSFRITRSRGTTDQADPSVAIAKAAAAANSSASPKSPEHTPSRPIMLRVTRSMENIAEAGLKEGLVIPEASVRSVRVDDASSSGTRSPAGTPLTPSTQMQLQMQQDQRYDRRPSESPASAGLRSPSIAESLPDEGETSATASELKLQLQRDLRTTLPDNLALKSLRTSLNKTADIIAVAVATPAQPYRPKNGPRDYMLELLLVDPSSAPKGVHVAHIFRPHQQSLPSVQVGDVVLLRSMTVVSVKGRGFGLRVGDASAWAVFDEQARHKNGDGDAVLPQIKGPPVEVMEAEVQYALGLHKWWTRLDEGTMAKIERAAQRMLVLS